MKIMPNWEFLVRHKTNLASLAKVVSDSGGALVCSSKSEASSISKEFDILTTSIETPEFFWGRPVDIPIFFHPQAAYRLSVILTQNLEKHVEELKQELEVAKTPKFMVRKMIHRRRKKIDDDQGRRTITITDYSR